MPVSKIPYSESVQKGVHLWSVLRAMDVIQSGPRRYGPDPNYPWLREICTPSSLPALHQRFRRDVDNDEGSPIYVRYRQILLKRTQNIDCDWVFALYVWCPGFNTQNHKKDKEKPPLRNCFIYPHLYWERYWDSRTFFVGAGNREWFSLESAAPALAVTSFLECYHGPEPSDLFFFPSGFLNLWGSVFFM